MRIPANHATAGGKDAPNMRESRGKAKQYTTINGRTVVIKDAFVYSNKGWLKESGGKRYTDSCDRIQNAQPSPITFRYDLVPRFLGAATMAGVLYFEAVDGGI